ncbi:MAG TPA: hypothetical protein VHS96_14195 [Bacteroidia bacterium]|nr:hypothetical protein [Bacteroidia bacterium]
MSLAKTLAQLEERYYDELEEDRNAVIEELAQLHQAALAKGIEEFRAFSGEAMQICGGVYIPYILWVELAQFIDHQNNREQLFGIMQAFVDSGFEEEERRKMKTLLITYFAIEREFEVNKILTLIVDKAHPSVQEFFKKVQNFVAKNKTSVDMYIEKFKMLKSTYPNFEWMSLPLVKLKEHL